MGEVTENNRTFVLPNESQVYSFKMKYSYDSWKICASRMKRKLVFCSEAQPNLRVANRVQGEIKENILVVLNQYAAGAQASPHSEDECYWYHPDHLGSASWVSDKAGKGIQYLYYLPWGEELDNQRATDYASRYTFSGKERDMETGYGYFGARHYNSALSIWLSVDPMADKYPGVSPYTYCANNPVKLVDPDGREWLDPEKDGKIAGELIYRAKQAICRHEKSIQKFQKWADKATDPKQKNDLEKGIADHKQRIDLLTEAIAGITEMGNKEGVYFHYNVNAKRTTHNVQLIRANDDNKHDYISINVKDSYIIQMHETVHAFDYMQGKYCLEFSNNGLLGSRYYHDESEIHAYQVEYSLSSTKERFPNIVHVQDINKKTIKSIEDAAPNSP